MRKKDLSVTVELQVFSFISDFLLFHEEEAGLERHEKVHSDVTDVVKIKSQLLMTATF